MLEAIKKVITKEVMKFYDCGPPTVLPSRLLYIPKRTYPRLYGPATWEFGGELLGEFTIPLSYIGLPPNDMNPLPPTYARFVSKSSYFELMSNLYLYLGYVHHVFVNHSKKFLSDNFEDILREFENFSKGQTVFPFKVPRTKISSWNSSFPGFLAKRIKFYNNVNLSTATKLRVSQSNAQFFTDKALTPGMLEDIYFISNVEIKEVEKHYSSILYYNCVYQMIIEGCYEYKRSS
jgi:hypothetical protein